jgi:tetratricopeptide (TPR) repeat protein/predicted ATP-binding protein involved in virulence
MGTIDPKLHDYAWKHLDKMASVFSEKSYRTLLRFKEKKDKEGFIDTLEIILDFDEELLSKIRNQYETSRKNILSIKNEFSNPVNSDEDDKKTPVNYIDYIIQALEITPYRHSYENKKNIRTALYFINTYKVKNEKYSDLLNNLAKLYFAQASYKNALPLYLNSLSIREKLLGDYHVKTAISYNNLAELYESLGAYKKAKPLFEKSLMIREKILGESHPDTARSYYALARFYESLGSYEIAKKLSKKSLKIRKKILGDDHPDTASSYNSLAILYRLLEDYEKSEHFSKKALKIREKTLGEDHPDTASSYNSLAILYGFLKDYKKSEFFSQKSLKIRLKILGKNHPDTASSYHSVALSYAIKKDYETAKLFLQKALTIRKEVLGKNHPSNASSYHSIALIYALIKDDKKAEKFFFKTLKISVKTLGYDHKNTLKIHQNIDLFYQNLNKHFFSNSKNSNLNFKIDSIKIKNFKQYSSLFEMHFSEKINIIIGQNAIGKTTLLQAITLGILKENAADEETTYFKYITKKEEESDIVISHNNQKKTIKILKNKREIKNNYFIPFVLTYGSNFFTDYKESDPIVQRILNETITENFSHTIFLEHTDRFWNPLSILRNLAISKHKKANEKKKIVFDTLNDFLKVEGYQLVADKEDDTRFHFVKGQDKTILDLSELSEGYRGNVLLITDMLIKILGVGWTPKTIEGIVLIDEFDRHLHPKWQSKLVNTLLNSFPNIQFIMTTHNPMSILDRNPDEIIILKETSQGIKAVKGRGTKTIDVATILLEYFDVESTISASMKEKIDAFNQLKLKTILTQKEQQELTTLEDFLGQTVASNFIYDRKYLQFLEYIKEHKTIDFDRYQTLDVGEMNQLLEDFGDFFDD